MVIWKLFNYEGNYGYSTSELDIEPIRRGLLYSRWP
jgi:hypothetical protein